MKINVDKTNTFAEKTKNTSLKLDEIKDELNRVSIRLSADQTEVEGITAHISKIEKQIDESIYNVLKMSVAAQRISENFSDIEKRLERTLENKPALKLSAPETEFINVDNLYVFKGIMDYGENN